MKTLITLSFLLVSLFSSNAQWTTVPSGTGADIEGLCFVDSLKGFCSGVSSIKRTVNGGDSWLNKSTSGALDLDFVNFNTGYSVSVIGYMAVTTNGGNSWNTINPPKTNSLWSVDAIDENTAYFGGTGGVLWKTTNGGASVTVLNSGTFNPITDIHFNSNSIGYIVAQSDGVKKTSNAGSSWTTVYTPPSGVLLTDIHFVNNNTGYVVGSDGLIAKTVNAGQNWTKLSTNSNAYLQAVHFYDIDNGIAVGYNDEILITNDGGTTWESQTSGTNEHLNNVFMTSAKKAIIVGDNGTILKNDNISIGITDYALQHSIIIYPNPTPSSIKINISSDVNEYFEAKVYSGTGNLIKQTTFSLPQTDFEIDLSEQSSGIYYLKIISKQNTYWERIIKQ